MTFMLSDATSSLSLFSISESNVVGTTVDDLVIIDPLCLPLCDAPEAVFDKDPVECDESGDDDDADDAEEEEEEGDDEKDKDGWSGEGVCDERGLMEERI